MPQTWVNPSDFRHSRTMNEPNPSVENSPTESSCVPCLNENETKTEAAELECVCPTISKNACESYFIRVLNKLLIRSNLKNFRLPKESVRIVPLTLYFNAKNLEILQHFASENDLDTYSWTDFDEAFNSIFMIPVAKSDEDTESTKTNEEIIEERDYALFFFITIVSALLIIGLWLFLKSGSIFKSFGGIYLVTFSIALVWNLIRAYKIEKAKISRDTDLLKEGIANRARWKNYVPGAFLRFLSIEDELLMHYQYDPMINVDFGAIVVETFFSFLNVLPMLGTKIGQMTHNFYVEQNFFVRFVVSTFNFLVNPFIFGLIVMFIIAMHKGLFLKIPLLFTLSIGQSSKNAESSRLENSHRNADQNRIANHHEESRVDIFPPLCFQQLSERTDDATQSQSSRAEISISKTKSRNHRYPVLGMSRKGRVYKRRISTTNSPTEIQQFN